MRIITDFDGIFSHDMLYNKDRKEMKSFGFGVRHAFELLNAVGFEPPLIVTGDATGNGAKIAQKFMHNIPHEFVRVKSHNKTGWLRRNFIDKSYIWIGEDIYDIDTAQYAAHYFTIKENDVISKFSNHSFPQKYFWLNFAEWAIMNYTNTDIRTVQSWVAQPNIVQCMHEELKQHFLLNATPTGLGQSYACVPVMGTDQAKMKPWAALIDDVLGTYDCKRYTNVSARPALRIMVDVLPEELEHTNRDFFPTIVILQDKDPAVAKKVCSYSNNFRASKDKAHCTRFYYADGDVAAWYEEKLSKSDLFRGLIPKLISTEDISDCRDKELEVRSESSTQMTFKWKNF